MTQAISLSQYNLIYNSFSFTFIVMASATVFFWLCRDKIAKEYKIAITITSLVTFIAAYHYMQIFLSFERAYEVKNGIVSLSGLQFNDAYRYVDWLLTVPLLLIELILVMNLPREKTVALSAKLAFAAVLMVILGYPGEGSMESSTRWTYWSMSMIPFIYIVYNLFFGLRESIEAQPKNSKGLVKAACMLTVISWCFYPIVYILPMLGLYGNDAVVGIQIGYSIADIVAKAVFGLLVFEIARSKSEHV